MTETHAAVTPDFDPVTGPLVPISADGRDWVVVVERAVALPRWCPHKGADMARGVLVGRALKCPLHGYMFEVSSGRGLNCPLRVETVPARLVDGEWQLAATPAQPRTT
jgi:nitrite reductase/ring-hydroxylating ferredoxin subunit